uniref:BspA family leucine-rich repeat surface protein n=1 Tax=Amphora coffeiformis TaxID=265554 RepID=A0A7S3P7L5_9STRA
MGRRLEVVKEQSNNDDDGSSSVGSSARIKAETIWFHLVDSTELPTPSTDIGNYDSTTFQANLGPSTMYPPHGGASSVESAVSSSGSSVDGADEPSTIRSFHGSQDGSGFSENNGSIPNKNAKKASKQLHSIPLVARPEKHIQGERKQRVSIPVASALKETLSDESLQVIEEGIKPTTEQQGSTGCCKRHGWYILLGVVVGVVSATAVAVAVALATTGGGDTSMSSSGNVASDGTPVPTISSVNDTIDSPTHAPTSEVQHKPSDILSWCFETKAELQQAVDSYVEGDRELAKRQYGEIESWCVSLITDFSNLFKDRRTFNEPLHHWDVSNAVTTESMFENAILFNQNLTRWNTKSVQTMDNMFKGATSFDGDVSAFDTSNVVSMASMFGGAAMFTGKGLSLWDTARVQTMNSMFHKTQRFNENLSTWNTSSVKDMSLMFLGSRLFDGDISTWDTSRVTSMRAMFQGASAFQGDISKWNTSAVVDMARMFWLCSAFNSDLSSWDVTNVLDMSMMFRSSPSFSADLCSWRSMISVETLTESMFLGSGCPESLDPDLTVRQGSFCFPCI